MIASPALMNDEDLFRSYAAELTRYANGLVGPFDAADVVADAWLKAISTANWDLVIDRRAYLYRTVLSVATDHHRSTLSRRLREVKVASPESFEAPLVDVDVLRAIDRLSIQQRAAVHLTYWNDLTTEEVAERMGVSAGTVKRHLSRAKKRLKEWLA
jgi:RNA polymerase sigma factor (sigma-70 family)